MFPHPWVSFFTSPERQQTKQRPPAVASLTVASPVLVYLVMGEHADAGLTRMKECLSRNNNAVMAVLLLVFAAKLIGDGITLLSG
jgi:hypothetical protein